MVAGFLGCLVNSDVYMGEVRTLAALMGEVIREIGQGRRMGWEGEWVGKEMGWEGNGLGRKWVGLYLWCVD